MAAYAVVEEAVVVVGISSASSIISPVQGPTCDLLGRSNNGKMTIRTLLAFFPQRRIQMRTNDIHVLAHHTFWVWTQEDVEIQNAPSRSPR